MTRQEAEELIDQLIAEASNETRAIGDEVAENAHIVSELRNRIIAAMVAPNASESETK